MCDLVSSQPEVLHSRAGEVMKGITPAGQQQAQPAGEAANLLPLPQPSSSAEEYEVSEADLRLTQGIEERKVVTPALRRLLRPWLFLIVLVFVFIGVSVVIVSIVAIAIILAIVLP